MTALTWRTIRRGEKWREKSGRFIIAKRWMPDRQSHVYRVYQPSHPYTDSILLRMLMEWSGEFDSLADAKAAAEARVSSAVEP